MPGVCIRAKAHAHLGTPPLTAGLLFVPDGDITSPLKIACYEHMMRKCCGKGLPSKNVQDLWWFCLQLIEATCGVCKGSELVEGEISDSFY